MRQVDNGTVAPITLGDEKETAVKALRSKIDPLTIRLPPFVISWLLPPLSMIYLCTPVGRSKVKCTRDSGGGPSSSNDRA